MAEEFTAKFKVDISDLKKNLADANKEIKLANATFKAQTAGMEDWAKNADGLGAKLKQLDTIISAQKSKLSSYKEQLAKQKEAYEQNGKRAEELRKKLQELDEKGVSKSSEEYKKYETALKDCTKEQDKNEKAIDDLNIKVLEQEAAVKNTQAEIDKYDGALEDLEKEEGETKEAVEETDEAVEKSSSGFSSMDGILAGLVAGGIALAVQALKKLADSAAEAWKEFDEGRDTIIKLTGATGESAKALQDSYKTVSKNIVADSSDIGTAIGEINTKFGSTGEELEGLTEKFLKFADINDADVGSSIDDVQKALAAYGLSVKDADGFLDSLTATSQATGVDVGKLTDGIVSNATAFQEMGLDVDQAVALMGQLEKSGANSETVLNGMRKALKNSAKDGKSLDEALLELQNQIEGSTDGVDGLNASYELFGKSGDQIYGAIKNGTLSFKDLTAAVTDSTGAVDETYEATRDATDNFKLAMQGLKVEVADAFDKFLQEHGPALQTMLSVFTDVVLPALITVISGVVEVVGFVIEAIADFISWIKQLWDESASFQEFWANLWAAILEAVQPVIDAIVEFFAQAWESIKQVWSVVKKWFSDRWNDIKKVFSNVAQWFKQKFTQAYTNVKNAFSTIGSWFAGKWKAVRDALANVATWFKTKFESAYTNVQNAFTNVGTWFKEKFEAAYTNVTNAFKNIGTYFSNRWKETKEAFSTVKTWFGNKFSEAFQAIKDKFADWGSFWGGLWTTISTKFSSIGTNISNAISGAVRSGLNGVISMIENTINSGIGLINGAIGLINKLPGVNVGRIGEIYLPRLAQGGILKKGQVGLLEGSGTEAVVPLSQNKQWIRAVANEMNEGINGRGSVIPGPGGSGGKVTNYTQNIYAPKQPSRIELYRQTRNLLALAEGRA